MNSNNVTFTAPGQNIDYPCKDPSIRNESLVIDGIKFFDNPSSCISDFESTHWSNRAISFLKSFGTHLVYGLYRISLIFHGFKEQLNSLKNSEKTVFSKKRLVVCIHGLNSSPSQFKRIMEEMQKRSPVETDIFIPRVLRKGNAALDEVVKPIFEEIAKWTKSQGDKELVLVGVSNGGRILRAIEAEVAKLENKENIKRVRVVSIVGAYQGSSLANLANKLGFSWLMSKNISKEMPTDSDRMRKLDKDWREGLESSPEIARDYTFIASPHDWQVPNYDSTLFEVPNQKRRYAIVSGHGHNSIVNAAAKAVAEIILP